HAAGRGHPTNLGAGTGPVARDGPAPPRQRRGRTRQLSRGGRLLCLGREVGDESRSLDVPPVAARGRKRAGVDAVAVAGPTPNRSPRHARVRALRFDTPTQRIASARGEWFTANSPI